MLIQLSTGYVLNTDNILMLTPWTCAGNERPDCPGSIYAISQTGMRQVITGITRAEHVEVLRTMEENGTLVRIEKPMPKVEHVIAIANEMPAKAPRVEFKTLAYNEVLKITNKNTLKRLAREAHIEMKGGWGAPRMQKVIDLAVSDRIIAEEAA